MSTVEQTFTSSFHTMLSALPSVRDGDADAIHDARVATRRVRAVLPVLVGRRPSEPWRDLGRAIKKMGRALGEARDVDVSLDLLRDVEARSPMTAPAAASMRARLLPEQARSRRALIKRLERVDVDGLSRIAAQAAGRRHLVPWRADRFAPRVSAAVVKRAGQARSAIDHATGVYFPRRAHALRVALKKLRYLVELLDARDGTPARAPARAQGGAGDAGKDSRSRGARRPSGDGRGRRRDPECRRAARRPRGRVAHAVRPIPRRCVRACSTPASRCSSAGGRASCRRSRAECSRWARWRCRRQRWCWSRTARGRRIGWTARAKVGERSRPFSRSVRRGRGSPRPSRRRYRTPWRRDWCARSACTTRSSSRRPRLTCRRRLRARGAARAR